MEKKNKIYVEKKISKSKGTIYFTLNIDLGYRVAMLSYDTTLCAELLNLTVSQLYSLEDGKKYFIGE